MSLRREKKKTDQKTHSKLLDDAITSHQARPDSIP